MITEDHLEQQCLGWFREGGWETVFSPDSANADVTFQPKQQNSVAP